MEILYHDREIAVCIKPVGMDSESQLPSALKEALGGEIYTLHRLDLNVGGVMVYARTKNMAAALSRAIQDGDMIKEYVAVVHGEVPESGDWEDLLWKDSKKNKVFVVNRERKGVKKARLEYKRLRVEKGADETETRSLVRIRLYTGRSHQIRVQFSSRNYPLVGDHKYGSRAKETEPMLFSCRITFPYKGETRSFEAMPDWAQPGKTE
ncbi:MAG: RNA pseudouridine synthase [Peptococcaceae bacterium]|nr:RNA pseudouridine synthase [Peptococcaceae bacterium]